MIDLESMVKSFRLAWLKRILEANKGSWKIYLRELLHRSKPFHVVHDWLYYQI